MVLCKYFQQGTCRFGQYCKFEHAYGNRSKTFGDEKNIALLVAEDVLQAERGGQWMLSCYGPFKERKCIPGMDDLSPEEVRWEMYQAQKTGSVDQIKAQYQQMCEAMKVKRDALKNPTPAIVQLLEEVQNSGTDNSAFGDKQNKGNFAFNQPQIGATNQPNQTSNVFGQKPAFGAAPSNPFGGGTSNTFGSNQQSSSIFGRTAAPATNSVFGGKPSFGGTSVFGGAATTAPTTGGSIFGGANKPAATAFGAAQSTPSFGGLASQSTNIFGNAATGTQSGFGQPPAFGATQVQNTGNAFLKPATAQGSVFGGAATGGSVFGGNAGTTAAAPTANSVFGAATAAVSSAPSGGGIFGQPTQVNAAFGGAPVFGGTAGFGAAQAPGGSVFGGQSAFGAAPTVPASTNVFGGNTVAAATTGFGALAQGATANAFGAASGTPDVATNAFGAAATTPVVATNAFGAATTTPVAGTNAFGAVSAIPGAATNVFTGAPIATAAGPFGSTMNPPANSVFATSASAAPSSFGSNAAFSKPSSFGFATPATNTTSVFGTTTATSNSQSPFAGNAFGNVQTQQQQQSVFASSTTVPAASANPFMQTKPQQQGSPFGIASSTQSSPFGNFAKPAGNVFGTVSVTVMIDETAYSADDCLTDDEKAAYRANSFTEGYIPLKPPTKELR